MLQQTLYLTTSATHFRARAPPLCTGPETPLEIHTHVVSGPVPPYVVELPDIAAATLWVGRDQHVTLRGKCAHLTVFLSPESTLAVATVGFGTLHLIVTELGRHCLQVYNPELSAPVVLSRIAFGDTLKLHEECLSVELVNLHDGAELRGIFGCLRLRNCRGSITCAANAANTLLCRLVTTGSDVTLSPHIVVAS